MSHQGQCPNCGRPLAMMEASCPGCGYDTIDRCIPDGVEERAPIHERLRGLLTRPFTHPLVVGALLMGGAFVFFWYARGHEELTDTYTFVAIVVAIPTAWLVYQNFMESSEGSLIGTAFFGVKNLFFDKNVPNGVKILMLLTVEMAILSAILRGMLLNEPPTPAP